MVMRILQALMVDGQQSPFFELIKRDLGTDFSPNTGFDSGTRETSFSIGLQGVRPADVPAVQEAIMDTFRTLAKTGFPREVTTKNQASKRERKEANGYFCFIFSLFIFVWGG